MHTPASVEHHYGDGAQASTWEDFFAALENLPSEFTALGITDYFSVEGYRRLLLAKANGRLRNIELLLPIVELRVDTFVGNSSLQKLNYHVVFSDALSPDEIDAFFLQRLRVEHQLRDGREPWRGVLGGRDNLIRFGEAVINATPAEKRSGDSPLRVGFANAAIPIKLLWELLGDSVFSGKFLTAIGVGEWSQMRWEGAGAVQKRDTIGRVDFVLTAAASPEQYAQRLAQLRSAQVNDRLIDASDAHSFSTATEGNRLGESLTWIKADPSFTGLRRALRRFEDRVHVGAPPQKLDLVRHNSGKYLRGIEIRKKDDADIDEKWFDVSVPLNTDLVAIIGNQGSGKSALTDAIALCANVPSDGFSFLTTDKFCDSQKKAAAFVARLCWEDGKVESRSLDDINAKNGQPRIQYVPQGFFERVTNEKRVLEDGRFYEEINKVVYSHLPEDKRLGCHTLQSWIAKRGDATKQRLAMLRQELSELNERIARIESECSAAELQTLSESVILQQEAIKALRAEEPPSPPEVAVETEDQQTLSALRDKENTLQEELRLSTDLLGKLHERKVALENARTDLETQKSRIQAVLAKLTRSLKAVGLSIDLGAILSVTSDFSILDDEITKTRLAATRLDDRIGVTAGSGLRKELKDLELARIAIENKQVDAARALEQGRQAYAVWQGRLAALIGEGDAPWPETLRGLELHLKQLTVDKPAQLEELYQERRARSRSVFVALEQIASVYREATDPVRRHIDSNELTRELYRLEFAVEIQSTGFAEKFFACVLQSAGSFAGQQAANELVAQIAGRHDVTAAEGATAFAEEMLENLRWNTSYEPPRRTEPTSLLRKNVQLETLYDLLFGFEYLTPALALSLNGKPLRQLSPGERGILLLVFYLVIDCGDTPLIIDQPEGNLNNQSIFQHLVPVFMAAKERRQVIIVTHNPNLAVVCDAEQIVHCNIDMRDGNKVSYATGPLENPEFNALSLDLLDGTPAAFESRRVTYSDGGLIPAPDRV